MNTYIYMCAKYIWRTLGVLSSSLASPLKRTANTKSTRIVLSMRMSKRKEQEPQGSIFLAYFEGHRSNMVHIYIYTWPCAF